MTPPMKPEKLKRKDITSYMYADGYNHGLDEMEKYYGPLIEKLVEALDFSRGAIEDAIYLDDGLDGDAGQAVIKMIDEALALSRGIEELK